MLGACESSSITAGDWGAIAVKAEPIEDAKKLLKDELLAGSNGY